MHHLFVGLPSHIVPKQFKMFDAVTPAAHFYIPPAGLHAMADMLAAGSMTMVCDTRQSGKSTLLLSLGDMLASWPDGPFIVTHISLATVDVRRTWDEVCTCICRCTGLTLAACALQHVVHAIAYNVVYMLTS